FEILFVFIVIQHDRRRIVHFNHRNKSPGILRPNLILDVRRSGGEAPSLPALLQQTSRSLGLERTAARTCRSTAAIKLCFVTVAYALPRTLSDAHRRVMLSNSPTTGRGDHVGDTVPTEKQKRLRGVAFET